MSEHVTGDAAALAIRASFSRLRRRLRELVADDELTASQVAVLARLATDRSPSTSDLAALEGMRPQSMATIVAGLEERGLVERHADPDDRRRQLVELTVTGRRRDRDGLVARRHWLAVRMDALSEADRRTVLDAAEILDRVAAE